MPLEMSVAGGSSPGQLDLLDCPGMNQRVSLLNSTPLCSAGMYILYWMSAAQRTNCNHTLEYAIWLSNQTKKPLWVLFCLFDKYPEANERHFAFMLEGLTDVADSLRARQIKFTVVLGAPPGPVVYASKTSCCVVVDCAYTPLLRQWRRDLAGCASVAVVQVEAEVSVPADLVSTEPEPAAATFRPKLHRQLRRFLFEPPEFPVQVPSLELDISGAIADGCTVCEVEHDIEGVLAQLDVDRTVPRCSAFMRGGMLEAERLLTAFLTPAPAAPAGGGASSSIHQYAERRNDPGLRKQSHLSPYLQYGHISPVAAALRAEALAAAHPRHRRDVDVFLEELLVRREFAVSFVLRNPLHGAFDGLPAWAREGLRARAGDRRPRLYGAGELERGATHDALWNAAQLEMVLTGKMHNYLRMYWAKQLLLWTPSPEAAFDLALRLNNRWELDGRGPNGYAGVAWCFGHADRPFPARPVFGPVRCMAPAGLEKRFPGVPAYLARIARLRRGPLPDALAFARLPPAGGLFAGRTLAPAAAGGANASDGPAAAAAAAVPSPAGSGHRASAGGRGGGEDCEAAAQKVLVYGADSEPSARADLGVGSAGPPTVDTLPAGETPVLGLWGESSAGGGGERRLAGGDPPAAEDAAASPADRVTPCGDSDAAARRGGEDDSDATPRGVKRSFPFGAVGSGSSPGGRVAGAVGAGAAAGGRSPMGGAAARGGKRGGRGGTQLSISQMFKRPGTGQN